ncbi:DNA packaging protein [Psittacid alphaherpesvirus 1]|uniref:Capsid vertex component 2 n=1 Tax=Psittacid herpesvirus 1 (isolate Amazon parrot/-/97-0001/1997) TaxID=670426 RepID=CVC2_PSHV1|nr:DNA packaging tegument protein UL25 [Psittacid alphaherpesvirus 1]Q6UDK7.1 RecName: Full=Capsid vertex component 2 [Psittacid herpesvirus 1 Amazon parrot/1997]AAQ73703.1 DNA packaging protein [Psittacid alphaherpesvirus 1]
MFGRGLPPLKFGQIGGDGWSTVLADPGNRLIVANAHRSEPRLRVETLIREELLTSRARIEDLERRNRAAHAALDRLAGKAVAIPLRAAAELKNVERPLEAAVELLEDMAERAHHEHEPAVVEDERCRKLSAGDQSGQDAGDDDDAGVIRILKNGSVIPLWKPRTGAKDFHVNFVTMAFAASGDGRVGFGSWYRALQSQLLDSSRGMERILGVSQDGRVSSRLVRAVIRVLRSAAEIYVGHRNYSAFEAAVMCLFQYDAAKRELADAKDGRGSSSGNEPRPASTFEEAIKLVPHYLRALQEDVRREWGAVSYAFDRTKLPQKFFSPVDAKKYSNGALSPHIVYRLFKARGVFAATGREVTKEEIATVDPDFSRFDDPIANLSLAFFPARRSPLSLHEDEPLMRAAIDAVALMMLLQRLMYNSDVYANSMANRFQAAAFFEGRVTGPVAPASGDVYGDRLSGDGDPIRAPGSRPPAAAEATLSGDGSRDVVSLDNNLVFLFDKYLCPMYRYDNRTEMTGFFPGLAAVCLVGKVRGVPSPSSAGDCCSSLINLVDLDLRKTENTGAGAAVVLTVHDAITYDMETGLSRLLSVFDVKKHMKPVLRAMNVETDSDLIYFLCLGCLPHHVTIA